LTGVPPFNDDTPEQIFQNILNAGKYSLLPLYFITLFLSFSLLSVYAFLLEIEWPKTGEISPEARDLISKLLARDPKKRLGSNGKLATKKKKVTNLYIRCG
jgi:serine/threonine protein kinase